MGALVGVLMTSRSGSSMVTRVFAEHGLRWQVSHATPQQPARGGRAGYPTYENHASKAAFKAMSGGTWLSAEFVSTTSHPGAYTRLAQALSGVDVVKLGVEYAPALQEYAELYDRPLRLVKVYRPPEDVAASLHDRTGAPFAEAVRVAEARYKLFEELPGPIVATPLLAERQWTRSGMVEAMEYCGYDWDEKAAERAIQQGFTASRAAAK